MVPSLWFLFSLGFCAVILLSWINCHSFWWFHSADITVVTSLLVIRQRSNKKMTRGAGHVDHPLYAGSLLLCRLFSSCGEWGLLSSCCWGFSPRSFSYWGARSWGRTGSRMHGLQQLGHMGVRGKHLGSDPSHPVTALGREECGAWLTNRISLIAP